MPSRTPICASQPSSARAFSTEGQRRCTSTSKLGRCSSSNCVGRPAPQASHTIRAISATVSSSRADTLKSSSTRRRVGHRGDDAVGDVVDVRERARLLAGAEDLQRPLPGEHLADQVGDRVRDARLVVGHLARPVGVERAADRVRQAVLVVQRAAVDLAGELREAVGRARHRASEHVLLGGRELGRALEDHRRGHVHEPLDAAASSAARKTRVVERRCSPRAACAAACGSWRSRRRSRRGGSRGCSRSTAARACVEVAQVAGMDLAALAHPGRRRSRWSDTRTSQSGSREQAPHDRGADRAGAAGHEDARGHQPDCCRGTPLASSSRSASTISRTSSSKLVARLPAELARAPWRSRRSGGPPRPGACTAGSMRTCSAGSRPTCSKAMSTQLAHAVRLAGRDHVVVRLVLLEHQPHRLDVVPGEAPVALGRRGCRARSSSLKAELDRGRAVR